jgi:hypothetical protein
MKITNVTIEAVLNEMNSLLEWVVKVMKYFVVVIE